MIHPSSQPITFLTELPAHNAVRIGALYHKRTVLTSLLAKSVRLVAHEVLHDGTSYFGKAGSCTLVSYRGRGYVVTTRHQLQVAACVVPLESQLATLRFATTEGGFLKNIPVNLIIHENSNPNEEYHDLLFFGVDEHWLQYSADHPYFLPLEGFSNETRRISFFYGHPLARNEFQYEPLHAFVRIAHIDGNLDRTYRPNAEYLHRYTCTRGDYDVNGFSGGAAFSLLGDADCGWSVVFDGVIVRGGNGYLYVVGADYIARALAISTEPHRTRQG